VTSTVGTRLPEPAAPAAGLLRRPWTAGAVAGVAGGLVFGAAMAAVGTLTTVASIVRTDSVVVGFVVHLVIAAAIGAGFGVLVAHQQTQTGDLLFWGVLYGGFWWFVGPLTLLPLLLGHRVAWDLPTAQTLLPSLFGHLAYGAATAVVFAALRSELGGTRRAPLDTVLRGVVAGMITASALYVSFHLPRGAAFGWIVAVGAGAGLGYPVLFGARSEGTGPAIVRGSAYGFLWWVLAGLAVPRLLSEGRLEWSRADVLVAVNLLPLYLLLGAGVAAVFTALGGLTRWLFVDDVRMLRRESVGARGLRATGFGAVAGLIGGLAFTAVMVLADGLPGVAAIVGARSPAVGLVVHLVIAQLIGVSYAVLFRRRSFDVTSGLGWGVCYGFLWWVLGDLTLLPILTGRPLPWGPGGLGSAFPSLVGHLAYGAALGVVFHLLEDRANPWWFTRNEVEADRAAMRQDTILGSGPAVWGFTVMIALTVPLLVTS